MSRIHNHFGLIVHPYIQRCVIWESIAQERVSARVPRTGSAFRNADCFLPDWPRVSYFKDFCLRVEELTQVGKINMRADMIRAEIMHRIKRCEIDPLRDFFSGFNIEGRLFFCSWQ